MIADVIDGAGAKEDIARKGAEAICVHTDVSNEESVKAMADAAVERLVGSTFCSTTRPFLRNLGKRPFVEISSAEWDQVLAVNLKGVSTAARRSILR